MFNIAMIFKFLDWHSWRDVLECLSIILATYMIISWLARDKTVTLLHSFYSWCALCSISIVLQLEIVTMLLIITLPLFVICFVLFHQQLLQKNFVSYKTVTLPTLKNDWLEHLVRAFLHANHQKITFCCVIERHDSLVTTMSSSYIINAPLSYQLIGMVHQTEDSPISTLWVSHAGILYATKLILKTDMSTNIFTSGLESIHEYALLLSTMNDMILITNNKESGLFHVIMDGKHLTQLSGDHLLRILRKTIISSQGENYASSQNVSSHQSPLY